MPSSKDWLPKSRELQLAMANDWLIVLDYAKVSEWNIPQNEVTDLTAARDEAQRIFNVIESKYRNEVDTADCNAAFKVLTEKMRFFKKHYFLEPPLMDRDLISLGLKPPSGTHVVIPPPVAQATADVVPKGEHLLELHLRQVNNTEPDPHRSDYGFRIYFGILTLPGTPPEKLRPGKRELANAPTTPEELPHSRFTRRKKELFDFDYEDRGKTVFFCVRYENAKGEPGPWGTMFSAIIL
ncbi:MAG: hypothetical protein LBL39_04985 [Planctomycetaceae bacterium]|jgi:hypothetical protein|nr:hypothetical protein [Planctomycetaceae bacterium]